MGNSKDKLTEQKEIIPVYGTPQPTRTENIL